MKGGNGKSKVVSRSSLGLVAAIAVTLAACSTSDPSESATPGAPPPVTTDMASASTTEATSTTSTTVVTTRPDDPDDPTNVIVVMTDDQTVEQMRWLPTVTAHMSQGTEFTTSLTNYPLCGPSRATFLTGQHATNHGLDCNSGLAARFHDVEENSLGPWLQQAGVYTIHVGKYLNGYGGRSATRYVPVGWDDWRALAGAAAYKYENFDMVLNGEFVEYGRDGADDYSTDVLNDHLDEALRSAPATDPFFAVFTPLAPHYEGDKPFAVPAVRHEDLVTDVLRPENHDSCATRDSCPADGGGLNNPILTDEQIGVIDNGYQTASETLFAVDEAFERMIDTLTELNELDNTIIIFTSDNGFFYGEHGIVKGKILPGREALFVPLYIAGPGFSDATTEPSPVSNVDLAPTIVDIFDATPGLDMDGQSLLEPVDPDRALLIQAAKGLGGGYFGTYADGWLFYDWVDADRNELYAPTDPLQIETLDEIDAFDSIEASLAALTADLRSCAGAACLITWTADGGDDDDPVQVNPVPTDPPATDPPAPGDDDVPVDAPTEVTASGTGSAPTVTARAGDGSLQVTWEPVTGADAYRYRVAEGDGEPAAWIRVDLSTELTLTDLDPAITYTIEVSARRDGRWRPSTRVALAPLAPESAGG